MFNSEILETAIGLVLVYTLVSLICSSLMEAIARLFNLRGRVLRVGLEQMLLNQSKRWWASREVKEGDNKTLVHDFYEHPLIKSFEKQALVKFDSGAHPSYISAHSFATTLVDLIGKSGHVDSNGDGDAAQPSQSTTLLPLEHKATDILDQIKSSADTVNNFISSISADDPSPTKLADMVTLSNRMETLLNQATLIQPDVTSPAVAAEKKFHGLVGQVETYIQGGGDQSAIKQELDALLTRAKAGATTAQETYNTFLTEVENWYDDMMSRVTGWYTRNTRTWIIFIALGVTLAFNVDTLAMANALYTNASLRDAVVNSATTLVDDQNEEDAEGSSTSFAELSATLKETGLPIGWICQPTMGDDTFYCTALPRDDDGSALENAQSNNQILNDQLNMGKKFLGLLLSVLAIQLGAPFWFDLLNRLVNMRSSGEKPKAVEDAA